MGRAACGVLLALCACGSEVSQGDAVAATTATAPVPAATPPALTGVHEGAVTRYRHPDGIYSCDLPRGWTIAREAPEGVIVNPGLKETDTLDCLLVINHGELAEEERGMAIAAIFQRNEESLRTGLAQQGIELDRAAAAPAKVAVGERAGVEQEWHGRGPNGPLTVWIGAITEREYYLAVMAVLMDSAKERYLPGCKRVFASLEAKAPVRNPVLEQALVGGEYAGSSSFGGGGSISTVYEFAAGSRVKKTMITSGIAGVSIDVGGSTEEWGTFRAVGELVYLQFRSGQEVARAEAAQAGSVPALRFGNARYGRR